MTQWDLFAGVALIVLVGVLAMSRATERALTRGPVGPADPPESAPDTAPEGTGPSQVAVEGGDAADPNLLLGAAASQGLVGLLLAVLAWYAQVPPGALGLDDPTRAVLPGVALGLGLAAANEAGAWAADRVGIEADETLRELLAPDTPGGWALLLVVVLPIVALVEELLFRGALIGALAAGFSLSPWLLAVLSSIAFGLGHGLQGPGGVLVTGVLGFVLAAAFVLTGSLWVVALAHYLVNAIEFLRHEWA